MPSPKNSTNLPTTLCWRRISVTVSTRSVAVTPSRSWPGELKAHHIGREEVHRLAQHGGSASMPPTPQPTTPMPLIDGGVAIGAHQGVGVVDTVFSRVPSTPPRARYSRLTLVHDAKTRRHHTKGVKRLHAPFHELVALAVALEFELHVQVQRILLAVVVHHDRVVTTRSTGTSGSIFLGFLPRRTAVLRMAARSASKGTPVKSCSTTATRRTEFHPCVLRSGAHWANCFTCSAVTLRPSQLRSTDSRTIRIDTGSLAICGNCWASAGSE